MAILFGRVLEFSVYAFFWIGLLMLVSCIFCRRKNVRWQYIVAVCIALHLIFPFHIQWFSLGDVWEKTVGVPSGRELLFDAAKSGGQSVETDRIYSGLSEQKSGNQATGADASEEMKQSSGNAKYLGAAEDANAAKETETAAGADAAKETKTAEDDNAAKETETAAGADTAEETEMAAGAAALKETGAAEDIFTLFSVVWIAGVCLSGGKLFVSYLLFCRQAKRWSIPAEEAAYRILEQERSYCHLHRRVRLRRNGQGDAPLVYGNLHPVLLLPELDYTEEELHYIIRHELFHVKHGDMLVKYLFALCQVIYWFHPLVLRMCRRACIQMELLCDDAVVGERGLAERREYGMVILRHMQREDHNHFVPLTTGFYGGKKYMRQRFQNIMDTRRKKLSLGAMLLTVAVVVLVGGVKLGMEAGDSGQTAETVQADEENKTPGSEAENQNILLVGTDAQGFADAIVLVQPHWNTGDIEITNIPREVGIAPSKLASHITGERGKALQEKNTVSVQKLNTVFKEYGCEGLMGAVTELYDTEVDSAITMDYEHMRQCIDLVGGVTVELTRKEADFLNHSNYITKKKNRTLTSGTQLLNGDQATGYMRVRSSKAGSPVAGKDSSSYSAQSTAGESASEKDARDSQKGSVSIAGKPASEKDSSSYSAQSTARESASEKDTRDSQKGSVSIAGKPAAQNSAHDSQDIFARAVRQENVLRGLVKKLSAGGVDRKKAVTEFWSAKKTSGIETTLSKTEALGLLQKISGGKQTLRFVEDCLGNYTQETDEETGAFYLIRKNGEQK